MSSFDFATSGISLHDASSGHCGALRTGTSVRNKRIFCFVRSCYMKTTEQCFNDGRMNDSITNVSVFLLTNVPEVIIQKFFSWVLLSQQLELMGKTQLGIG